MASKHKKHRAMSEGEWMARLRRFATQGVWPSEAGNRPAPRQKKWHDLYQKIEKCPLQHRGQMSLFGGTQTCDCGFHTKKPSSLAPVSSTPSTSPPVTRGQSETTSGKAPLKPTLTLASPSSLAPVSSTPSTSPPVTPGQSETTSGKAPLKPTLTLASFTKPRFGGVHGAALKPNLGVARTHATKPVSTSALPSPAPRTPSPARSPRLYIQTVSPLSLPPSSVSEATSSSCGPGAASSVEVSAAASSGTSSAPLTPVISSTCVSSAAPFVAGSSVQPAEDRVTAPGSESGWLPTKLMKTIPLQDQKWISAALWKQHRLRTDLKLWYDPPEPALIYHQGPAPERFFTHRLLLWMPYHLWKVRLSCPVCGRQLTGYGAHKRARQVLDVDRFYLMITETLWCSGCKAAFISTSKAILDQLDLAHRLEFRLILTRKYACDMWVIRFLRERALGNSPSRLVRQLRENHSEEWLKRLCRYLGACSDFTSQPSLLPVRFQEPPEPETIPSHRWMLAVYGRDILCRIDHIKASITSTYGCILNMDSTKKITKKLSGFAKGTALWLTSVSNEVGQILISVLTAQEGPALDRMAADLIRRYTDAGVAPPQLLYVDCDCCREGTGQTKLKQRFGGWPDLVVKLDIYHFMRRLAAGCTKDAHPLYPILMARMSSCIFEWDSGDVSLLRQAKREQLRHEGIPNITDNMVDQRITKEELALHCRRRTRGEKQTILMIEHLLSELMGVKGRDLLGVPLLDQQRMQNIWQLQKKHVKCIQDEPGVLLYTQTGTTTKNGIVLPNYRCARGSTSLESFHLHLNRFIPGTSANSLNFQLYLLEGLNRWNQDRKMASLAGKPPSMLSYSGDLMHCVNTQSVKVLGRELAPSFQPPSVYTGELIGIDYLYRQTGQALQDLDPDSEVTDQMLEDVGTEEELEDEGFGDISLDLNLDPTIEALDLSSGSSPATTSVASTPASAQTGSANTTTAAPNQQLFYAASGPSSTTTYTTSGPSSMTTYATSGPSAMMTYTTSAPSSTTTYTTSGPSSTTTYTTSVPSSTTTYTTSGPSSTTTYTTSAPSSTTTYPTSGASSTTTSGPSSMTTYATSGPSAIMAYPTSAPSFTSTYAASDPSSTTTYTTYGPSSMTTYATSGPSDIMTYATSVPSSTSTYATFGLSSTTTYTTSGPSSLTTYATFGLSDIMTYATSSPSSTSTYAASGPSSTTTYTTSGPSFTTTYITSGPSAMMTYATSAPSATTTYASVLPLPTTLTVSVATAPPAVQPVPEKPLAVDERSVPGIDRVDNLASYLVGLRMESGQTLSHQQASTIIALWQSLLPYDQQRVAYAARHQVNLTTGRFRCSKTKPEFTPGVDSMTRCVLGSTGSPAQWPDCCRLVESIFVKLCDIHRSPKKIGNHAVTRWTLILRDYSKIRQLVLGNGTVMENTTLQLFQVNQTTLNQWHKKRLKRQECAILLQGVNLPAPIPIAARPLPPGQTRPTTAPPQLGPQHRYHLPASTVGKAVDKRKSAVPAPHPPPPKVFRPRQLFPADSAPLPVVPNPSPAFAPFVFLCPVPVIRQIAPAGPIPSPLPARRPYVRTVDKNKCSLCHQPRNKDTGHSQYYGHIYCPLTAVMPLDQWREEMKKKRADKKQ
ncbi:uncharacterized protein [Misgurnus anguillicaudatus]|uniref:uncharacterized protein n=1 Tax=Misgurnus anguillicaudatus TaxID=75329 RepID=UPI003CCF6688